MTNLDSVVHVEGKEHAVNCLCRDMWHAKSLGNCVWDMDSQGSANKDPEMGALKVVSKGVASIRTAENTRKPRGFMHPMRSRPAVRESLESAHGYMRPVFSKACEQALTVLEVELSSKSKQKSPKPLQHKWRKWFVMQSVMQQRISDTLK